MTKVTAQMSVSLDGFYTGPRDTGDPKDMSGWMQGPEAPGFFRVTRWAVDAMAWRERLGFAGGERSVNSEIIEETFAAAGAYVMGRRMFDAGEVPWGEEPPFHAPVFVLTHRPRELLERHGGTPFTFVTDGIDRCCSATASACSTPALGSVPARASSWSRPRSSRRRRSPTFATPVSGPSTLVLDDRGASGDLVGPAQPKL